MKRVLRVDALFELAVALALSLLIAIRAPMPLPGGTGSLGALAVIFLAAGVGLWLLSSRAGARLVVLIAAANTAGCIGLGLWLVIEISHLSLVGLVFTVAVATGFLFVAGMEVAELAARRS